MTENELLLRMAELDEANDNLREALLHHKAAMASARVVQGTGEVTAAAILTGGAAELREELTQALTEFDKARHLVRVALFAVLGADTSASEIGRSLGISRQLASRLAQEAEAAVGD